MTDGIGRPEQPGEWSVYDGLRVASIGDRDACRQVLVFMGMRACVEPFELQQSVTSGGDDF